MLSRAKAHIDLAALRHNLSQVKSLAPDAKILAVIKADAYGHGITEVAEALEGVHGFAVARLQEAAALRDYGLQSRLLVLSEHLQSTELEFCAQRDLDVVVHSATTLEWLQQASLPGPLNLWLKFDSGMHRLGLDRKAMQRLAAALTDTESIAELRYMTHFCSADETEAQITLNQISAFEEAIATLPPAECSLANSAALIRGFSNRSEWIRPGIMLYGANPLPPALQQKHSVDLKPVMTLTAPIIGTRRIRTGESVGYNHRWTAARDSVIATVAIGYGDGYPRHARQGTPTLIADQVAPLAGTVSMDMITVDITDCQGVNIGDEVTLWGKGLPAEHIAECAATISYELFTSVTPRVQRIYSHSQ